MNKPEHEKNWAGKSWHHRRRIGVSEGKNENSLPNIRTLVRKKFEGVGEISEGRTRSAKNRPPLGRDAVLTRIPTSGCLELLCPNIWKSRTSVSPTPSVFDLNRLHLQQSQAINISMASDQLEVVDNLRSRRLRSGVVTSSSCASWSYAPSSLPLTSSSSLLSSPCCPPSIE